MELNMAINRARHRKYQYIYNIHKNMTCLIIIILWLFVYGYIDCCYGAT